MKILELVESLQNVYVVGDSIAVGIQKAGSAPGITQGGKDTNAILGFVSTLVEKTNLQGTVVILSSGASNSTFERETGETKKLDVSTITKQITVLKQAGAKVALVGTGSSQSKWFTNQHGKYRVNFEKEQVNQKLENIAAQTGAVFLGPLENFDPSLNTTGDGIHPYNGYKKLFQSGSSIVANKPVQQLQRPQRRPRD